MRCELVAEVVVERFAVFAEMAWFEPRPELGALCSAALEVGGRIDGEVIGRVLPGVSPVGSANIADWCRKLGLCDAQGGLTALGEQVAAGDDAPVPEQGVFEMWVAQHPLLGARIIHAARLKSTRDVRFEDVTALPIMPDQGKAFSSVVEPGARCVLRALPASGGPPGCVRHRGALSCRIRWTLDFSIPKERWTLEGSLDLDGQRRPMAPAPEPGGIDLQQMLGRWASQYLSSFGRWQANVGRLAVRFDGLDARAQESFTCSYRLPSVDVPGKGTYANVELQDVPIGPASADDAQRWARARFDRGLRAGREHRTRAELRRLFASVVEGTPLQPFAPRLPDHETLLREARAEPSLFWRFAAPVDLSPVPLDSTERAAFVVDLPGASR
jgi:hypothetical protein